MSGASSALESGFAALKPGGEAALLGLTSEAFPFDLDDNIIFKGATVYGVFGRRLWQTWLEMRGLIRSGAVDLAPVVTHRFVLDDFTAAFELMQSGECGKVVMFPDPAYADKVFDPPTIDADPLRPGLDVDGDGTDETWDFRFDLSPFDVDNDLFVEVNLPMVSTTGEINPLYENSL